MPLMTTTFTVDETNRLTRCQTKLFKSDSGYITRTTFGIKDLDWGEDEERTINRLRGWVCQSVNGLSRTLDRQYARWRLTKEADYDRTLCFIRFLFE